MGSGTDSADFAPLTFRQCIEMATINGARALGLGDVTGSITPGKRADLILIRSHDVNVAPVVDLEATIVRSVTPANVDTVLVDGRVLKRGGELVAVDVDEVVRNAEASALAVRTRAGGRLAPRARRCALIGAPNRSNFVGARTVLCIQSERRPRTGRDWGNDVTESDGTISGGHLVARALKNEGVDVIFTLCGGHIIDIYDGCIDEGIDIIDVRHEQVAAHAADGYARMTGRPGVAVVTAGPGTTDAVTGVANAFRAESPMLLIGGQGALSQHKMGSLQDLPHVDMMAPITKFAATVPSTARVADMVSHGLPRVPQRGARAVVPRDPARHPRRQGGCVDGTRSRSPAATEHRPARPATPTTSSASPTSSWPPSGPASCSAARCGRAVRPTPLTSSPAR